ncbi:TNT domain-containing protein [Phyllobacterium meliloti]|uniref:TNT domain-containing protein n=1 Tax=Phyllobacterium meliloti TaxID=555317 RepID=UPI001D14DEDE|nr:TNT domain-containing protein [Phyllobacterium sp. T1293]UGX85191.1 TNT domain-containing protein [Phyllobacterium sp. T1293]
MVNPDITMDGSQLPSNCSYVDYVGNKLYEYVAVIKLIKELATSEAARQSLFDGFMDSAAGHLIKGDVLSGIAKTARSRAADHADAAVNGSWEDTINQFGHDWFSNEYTLPWAKDGSREIYHKRVAADETQRAATAQKAADFEYALAKEKAKEFFVSLWKAIEKRWRECGILYAVATTATDAVFLVGELALGAGLSAGAMALLKSVKFTAHVSLPAITKAVGSAAKTGARVTKDTLVTVRATIGVAGSAMRKLERTYRAGDLHAEFKLDDVHAGNLMDDTQNGIKGKTDKDEPGAKPNGKYTDQQLATAKEKGIDPKWVKPDGRINWPPNDGFDGPKIMETMPKGTMLDRYGDNNGGYLAPSGTPFGKRALPANDVNRTLRQYEVLKPLDLWSGPAQPWFDQIGGGKQFMVPDNKDIDYLIQKEYLKETGSPFRD